MRKSPADYSRPLYCRRSLRASPFSRTDAIVLLLGAACFITASFIPQDLFPYHDPLGEIFSGFISGVPALHSHLLSISAQKPVILVLNAEYISILINWKALIPITLALIPTTLLIAGIMLANNICDIEDDIANKRYTLPIYIGKKPALVIFNLLCILCYLDILVGIILGYLPALSLITLVPAIRVFRNLREFERSRPKGHIQIRCGQPDPWMAPLSLSVLMAWIMIMQQ